MWSLGSRLCRQGIAAVALCLLLAGALVAEAQTIQSMRGISQKSLSLGSGRDVAPVILNEYNAVRSSRWLDCDGLTCSDKEDIYFGRVKGNGGNWFELVVTQDHLDMRNWRLDWTEQTTPSTAGSITLTGHALWSDLRAGTIVTFSESDAAHGGRDTDTTFGPALGDWWININTLAGDPNLPPDDPGRTPLTTYATTTTDEDGDGPGNFSVGEDDWQLTIVNAANAVVFGPCGEGIPDHDPGVNSREVFKLEENPSASINPVTSAYQDGTSSTFGHPNSWSDGSVRQDFSGLRTPGNVIAMSVRNSFNFFANTATSLPPSDTTVFAANSVYFVEVWAQTMHPTGLSIVSADLLYNDAKIVAEGAVDFTPDGVFHTNLFGTLPHHEITSSGINDLSGAYLPPTGNCTTNSTGVAPNWSRVAVIRMKALQSGSHHLDLEPTGSSVYLFGVCGTVVDPDEHTLIEYRDINEPTGALVLDVPNPVQSVTQGEQVTVELQATALNFPCNGAQALIHFNPTNLRLVSVTASPGWMAIHDPNGGDVFLGVFKLGGSIGPGGPFTLATLTFTALDAGTPIVSFLPDNPPSFPNVENRLTEAEHGLFLPVSAFTNTVDGDIDINACDDNNACTDDSFDSTPGSEHCVFVEDDTNSCSDGNACNGEETCSAGVCQSGAPLVCDDGNPCTDDTCDPLLGCVYVNDDSNVCADSDVCDGAETCSAGVCVSGTPLVCDDGNPCTDDTCDPVLGCVYVNDDTNVCADSDVCDGAETCSAGVCVPGTPLVCDDSNPCTDDTCDPGSGCVNTPDNTNTCDNGLFCDGIETCQGGTCVDGADPCVDPAHCDEVSDLCLNCTGNSDCDDGNACNGAETCDLGTNTCVAGTPLVCNDGNPCTDDTCDPGSGCVYSPDNNNSCSDGDACNGLEACVAGVCEPGTPLVCNDSNPCTDDTCDPGSGCVYTPDNNNSCSDGDACNGLEACVAGVCEPGTPLVCDDSNPCTDDACDPGSGCAYTANDSNTCSDGQFCNGLEVCQGGACQPGVAPDCSDADPCTIDACDELNDVCTHTLSINIVVNLEIQGLANAVTRDVDFLLTDCGGTSWVASAPVAFSTAGTGTAQIPVADTSADWIQIIEGHTLARLLPVTFTGCTATVDAVGTNRLLAGDFSNHQWVPQDNLVDIQDFAILSVYWEQAVDANLGTQADADGDGMQDVDDFYAIQSNFGDIGEEAEDCPALPLQGSTPAPRIEVAVAELPMPNAHRADVNNDGWVDTRDIVEFAAEKRLTLTPQFRAKLERLERKEAQFRR